MLPSCESITKTKRDSLQCVVDKAEQLEELVKLFSYIDISTTKAFLSSAIGELDSFNLNYAYFGARNIEEILCRELLQHIFSFLYVFERYKYAICSHTLYSIIYMQAPSSTDITHYETWISFDINNNVQHKHVSISDMLFLYSKQYPTYIKLNPLKLTSIHYLLHKLHLNIKNIKIGAMGISLINRLLMKYEGNEDITRGLKEWLCSLESIAFVANDINTINLFLSQYKPKLMYLSMDSVRYNTTMYNNNNNHRFHVVNSNYAATTLHQYLSDELNEGYDAPQPTPTPAKSGLKDGSSSNGNTTLSSDYSASDDDDTINGFFLMNESSDGYHHEGHIQSHSNNKHRLFRASHIQNYNKRDHHHTHHNNNNHNHHHHHTHHRYRTKHRKHSSSASRSLSLYTIHNMHNMMRNVSLTDGAHANVIEYSSVDALQIFSSYSEIRISSIAYLMRNSIKYLGIDINIQSQHELHELQQIIYDTRFSPYLEHLSITDFKDLIVIPNRIHSLVIQRWFNANLSNLYFSSQFFPYNLSHDISHNYCYLSLNALTKRLYALSINKNQDDSAHDMYSADDEQDGDVQEIIPNSIANTTSHLFEIKLLLNFDVTRNRWLILKEQYEFLLRLRMIEKLSVIHLVMLDQEQINKHSNQYYSVHGHGHHDQYNRVPHGNIHNLHGNNNCNTKKVAIYDFPPFHCKWHTNSNKEFHVIAPSKCCKNKVFRCAFPPQTQFYAFNPMIRNAHYSDDEWLLRKKLMQVTDLFAVGLPNQLQHPC